MIIIFLQQRSLHLILPAFVKYRSTTGKYKDKIVFVPIVSPKKGEGTPHMKGVGMFVVSLRHVNYGFWSHLGRSGQKAINLAVKLSFRVAREKI